MGWFQQLASFYNLVRPILDIAILAFLLYKAYDLLVKTQAIQLIRGVVLLALVYGVAFLFKLRTLLWILNMITPVLIIAIAIVFQPELRKIMIRIGQGDFFRLDSKPRLGQLEAVITAAESLSKQRRGAIVVFARRADIQNIIETGTKLNADLSSALIITIFEFDGPLHDGALVIHNGRIAAAGCFLPLSEQQNIRKSFGTRHRSALGISEQTDAVVLVVSEETGAISLAYDAKLYYDLSIIEVQLKLREILDRSVRKTETEQQAIPSTAGDSSSLDGL